MKMGRSMTKMKSKETKNLTRSQYLSERRYLTAKKADY